MKIDDSHPLLLPTAYFPPISYFRLLYSHPTAVVEVLETYPKQTLRNRTEILSANGILQLSVPVIRPNGNHTLTKDIAISYSEPWNIRHWRALVSAYNNSPYFLYYRDPLEQILLQRHTRLIDLNQILLQQLLRWLKLDCRVDFSTQFMTPKGQANDFRYSLPDKLSSHTPYYQVFNTRFPFQPNLSILDLLFNLGPEATGYWSQ